LKVKGWAEIQIATGEKDNIIDRIRTYNFPSNGPLTIAPNKLTRQEDH